MVAYILISHSDHTYVTKCIYAFYQTQDEVREQIELPNVNESLIEDLT